ncbi:MAG: PQQ-binding-like beta-propeller repeat protein [Paludibacteraceae bacterium]|nr:PQQ-binding-like beta-propeller repeat protein [Paludibacteraceae bacterium]
MRKINVINGVEDIYSYKDSAVIGFNNSIAINDKSYPLKEGENFVVRNNVLKIYTDTTVKILQNNDFIPITVKYWIPYFFSEDTYIEYDSTTKETRFVQNNREHLFMVNTDLLLECKWFHHNVLVFNNYIKDSNLLFYSTTGERLWEYKTENPDWKINRMCIPMVDDVVVIITADRNIRNEMTHVEGFNIKTGERLWRIESTEVPCHLIVGEDKMLYACNVRWYVGEDNHTELRLTVINPFTGVFENHVLKHHDEEVCVMSWNTCIYGNKLYYADNHPGCILGVVDIDKKQIVEEFSLNLKKGFRMGAPVVTEDKIYQFIRNKKEVWVFDK